MKRQGWSGSLARERHLFALAITFMTRLSVPVGPSTDEELRQCRRYFPLVGTIVGLLLALVYTVASWVFPYYVSAALTLMMSLLITGGLHEDGLADTMDGIVGGATVEKRLAIMKDSRVGSYGALALCAALLLRYTAILALNDYVYGIQIGLIVAATVSRMSATLMMTLLQYARLQDSKVVTLSDSLSFKNNLVIALTGLVIAILLEGPGGGLLSIVGAVIAMVMLRQWFKQRLGGFTGDTLGTTQQVVEILCYLLLYVWFQTHAV